MGSDVNNWLDIVRSLASMNASVRVSLSSKPVEEGGRYARVRVLALGQDGVSVIEEPGIRDLGNRLHPGDNLDILAIQQQTRLVGRCRVSAHVKHMLNETTRVDAVQVSPPVKVYSGQLRDFYRAPVSAGVTVEPIQIKIDPEDEAACLRSGLAEIDPEKTHKVRLVNISGGGMGLALVADRTLAKVFDIGTAIILHAQLPTLDKPLDIKGRIVHTEKLDIGDIYLGVSFNIDDPLMKKQVEDQLQRLSVWLQRHMLKKENKD
jgi:c-di-GMP-binding flagellar brake protein YcgR